jgi:hypothetical protein
MDDICLRSTNLNTFDMFIAGKIQMLEIFHCHDRRITQGGGPVPKSFVSIRLFRLAKFLVCGV